jgi:hypothetical protein
VRRRRALILGALALAAAGVPAFTAASTWGSSTAVADCRAVFGSMNDGVCLDGPSNAPPPPGTPAFGIGPTDEGGPGISSTPLFPGQTIQFPVAP